LKKYHQCTPQDTMFIPWTIK